ncbi:MAG: macro domain-containing protein [Oscillospiraceae bacterium]|nr:macro domain-containing protein [Oscillospiraceae bacterium]
MEHDVKTIVFPCIGTGVYAFSLSDVLLRI